MDRDRAADPGQAGQAARPLDRDHALSADGRVVALHVAAAHRAPMVAVDEVVAEAGVGLVGDRFHGTRHRHVTVQSAADLAHVAEALGSPVTPAGTRRNITVDGPAVPTTPGNRLRIGEVELEVVRIAAPCRIMDETLGPGGARALHARGGAVCRLLGSGTIRLGDPVSVGVRPA